MNFGQAIEAMRNGEHVWRAGRDGVGIFIAIKQPDAVPLEGDWMMHPFIYINTMNLETTNLNVLKTRVPWLPSQTDMLADDWQLVGNDGNIKESYTPPRVEALP